jgi:hypothetical protein
LIGWFFLEYVLPTDYTFLLSSTLRWLLFITRLRNALPIEVPSLGYTEAERDAFAPLNIISYAAIFAEKCTLHEEYDALFWQA